MLDRSAALHKRPAANVGSRARKGLDGHIRPAKLHVQRASSHATRCKALFMGLDFGTSGARATVVDGELPGSTTHEQYGSRTNHNPVQWKAFYPISSQ